MKKLFNLVTALVILHSGLYLSGCHTYQKELARYHLFSFQHPDELAKDCAKQFPVKDSLIKGQNEVLISTDTSYSNSEDAISADTTKATFKTGITRTITKIKRITDTVKRENTAKMDTLSKTVKAQALKLAQAKQQQVDTEKERDDYKKTSDNRMYWIIGLFIVIGGVLAYKVYSFFSGGFIKKIL